MFQKILLASLTAALACCPLHASSSKSDVAQYDITWDSPSKNASESMPVGGGDIGCNLWVEEGDLLFYIQRSGSFNESGEYAKLGRVRVQISPNPFTEEGSSFSQQLVLKEGKCTITVHDKKKKKLLSLDFWVDVFNPVINLDIQTAKESRVKATYESWRTEDKEITEPNRGRWSCFGLEGWPGKLIKHKDTIKAQDNGILFYHQNTKTSFVTELLVPQQGLSKYLNKIKDPIAKRCFGGYMGGAQWQQIKGTTEGQYASTPYTGFGIESKKASKNHQLTIATEISTDGNIKDWTEALMSRHQQALAKHAENKEKSQAWWKQFWDRSYININPKDPDPKEIGWQIARNYQVFRYQLGCNALGKYPTRFNGGNFTVDPCYTGSGYTHDPDWRAWGGDVFTSQNQRLLYWPMLKSGDFDAFMSQVNFYAMGLETAQLRVKEYFGHDGAMFCEYANEYGLEMGSSYGWEAPSHRMRSKEVPFGTPSIDAVSRSGGEVERGVAVNGSIAYHWESQVEHAYMLLDYHRFSGKSIKKYMPFIKQALIFFNEHYQARQKMRNGKPYGDDGKLVFYPSTACETYRGATNPTDLTQGIRACLLALLKLDESYLSNKERSYFKTYLEHLPELPMGEIEGKPVIKPADSYKVVNNIECPHYYPLFPFELYACDDELMPAFRNTWTLDKTFPKGMLESWHQDGIFFAKMRMLEQAKRYNSNKLKDSPRRFPTFWGPGHDWVPDHNWGGSGMIGLQEMLMQTPGDRIILLPCWPEDWEVSFKLHAPKNTVVEGEYSGGKLKYNVTPKSRRKDVEVFLGKEL